MMHYSSHVAAYYLNKYHAEYVQAYTDDLVRHRFKCHVGWTSIDLRPIPELSA